MTSILEVPARRHDAGATALEVGFPVAEVSKIAEQESWRKEVNRPLYHIHKWWATRLGSVFRAVTLGALSPQSTSIWAEFYKRHCLTGKVVLDPFMGSGTTLGEAIKLGAKAVGCDINPISTFLVNQALTRVPEHELTKAFRCLEDIVAPQIRQYYQTQDPETGSIIPVLYYFWVKTVTTLDGETIPLFDRYVFAQDAYTKRKPTAQIVCPHCWQLVQDRYDARDTMCTHCKEHFDPQNGPASGQYVTTRSGRLRIKDLLPVDGSPPAHRLYAMLALRPDGQKVYLAPRESDLLLYAEAELRLQEEDLPLPTLHVRAGHNTDQARGYNYSNWRDFFNARQLLCLGLLLKETLRIDDVAIQEQLLCLFSSTLEFNNMFCSYKGEGTGAVRHMFSNHILKPERTPLENSVWGTSKSSGTFSTLFESRLLRAKKYLDEPFELAFEHDLFGETEKSHKLVVSSPIDVLHAKSWQELKTADSGVLILNGDSASLPIPACSVDAVVTDPPYFDFVHYSELSDFFFAWLSPVLKDRYNWFNKLDSSDPAEVQHKDPRAFSHHFAAVLSECHRVLKDEGVLAFSFHHSRSEGWAAISEALTQAGFNVVAAHPVHGELRASNPKNAAKDPISLDAILVCRKHLDSVPHNLNIDVVLQNSEHLWCMLKSCGMSISSTDQFVIAASQMLVSTSAQNLSFDEVRTCIDRLHEKLVRKTTHVMEDLSGMLVS